MVRLTLKLQEDASIQELHAMKFQLAAVARLVIFIAMKMIVPINVMVMHAERLALQIFVLKGAQERSAEVIA